MRKIAELLEARLAERLQEMLDEVLDRVIDRVIDRVVGVDEPEAASTTEAKAKGGKAKAKGGKAKAKAEAKGAASAEATEQPALEAAAEGKASEGRLLARIEQAAEKLGPKYGPMLLRRVQSIMRRAVNSHSALAVIVAWVESVPPEEVTTILRGSERLSDGTVVSGWRLMVNRLNIPVE